jgi:hypothetical protein
MLTAALAVIRGKALFPSPARKNCILRLRYGENGAGEGHFGVMNGSSRKESGPDMLPGD